MRYRETETEKQRESETDSESDSEDDSNSELGEEDDKGTTSRGATEEGTTRVTQETSPKLAPEDRSAVPPMIVRPQLTPTATAYVQIAVSNENGTAPLVIRKGEALAQLRQISQNQVKIINKLKFRREVTEIKLRGCK